MTDIAEVSSSKGLTLTETLVRDGAPRLPRGYSYRIHIKHQSMTFGPPSTVPPEVTVRIGYDMRREWVEVARFTEVTRAHLHGATIAAAVHAYESWDQ